MNSNQKKDLNVFVFFSCLFLFSWSKKKICKILLFIIFISIIVNIVLLFLFLWFLMSPIIITIFISIIVNILLLFLFLYSWSHQLSLFYIIIPLTVKNKVEFIHGIAKEPCNTGSSYHSWKRCKQYMVVFWIVHSVSNSLCQSILWNKIEEILNDLKSIHF